ncbi:MAG: SCO family protein [Flavobacteriales bacterium]|nr:SCO family protein [Flavobacteriales bacterium]MCB9173928.1 SCO family protein [Flavobacteriales bacterium]
MKRLIPAAAIVVIGMVVAYFLIKPKVLPVFNPSDINPKLVDESVQGVTKLHRVGAFSLINQEGKTITEKDYQDKIYVTDFFFVTCPTICPKMTKQMFRVYSEFKSNNDVLFLSHTVMPENDSVPVLSEYAKKHNIDASKWNLVTGDKKQIYDLARKTYFAAITEGDGGVDDFIHTENFVLIDKEKRIRGFYDGTSENDVDRLINDINTLLNEYD